MGRGRPRFSAGLPPQASAGIFFGRIVMMKPSKFAAILFASLVLAPVLAAGRPACCKAPVAPVAPKGCCAAMSGAQAGTPKGCCKAPVVPKTDAKATDGAALALTVSPTSAPPAAASTPLPEVAMIRIARHAHRAPAPDDSPPDRLSRLGVLLI